MRCVGTFDFIPKHCYRYALYFVFLPKSLATSSKALVYSYINLVSLIVFHLMASVIDDEFNKNQSLIKQIYTYSESMHKIHIKLKTAKSVIEHFNRLGVVDLCHFPIWFSQNTVFHSTLQSKTSQQEIFEWLIILII